MFKAHACLPMTTDGLGCYGNTLGKLTSSFVDGVRADLLQIVQFQASEPDASVYTIGDYGCADGTPSMDLIRDVIALVRERSGGRRPVQVLYEDQHSNDFNSLFRRLHGEIPDPPTYLNQFPDVFTMATATNFFQQCAPDNSMDLILNFVAVHWLSEKPIALKNSVFCSSAASPEERKAYSQQAAKDWETFLLHRATELKAGGWLVLSIVVEDPGGPYSECTITTTDFHQAMEHVWQKFLVSGRISHEEFQRASAGFHRRRPEEVREPFLNPESPVRRAGLHMEELRLHLFPCPLMAEWRRNLDQGKGDCREDTAKKIMEVQSYWSKSIILNGLDQGRTDKEELVEAFFEEVQQSLLKIEPFSALRNDCLVAYLTIKKQ